MADKNIPRPEYPRPQFIREPWLNLNGEWEFAFDDSDQGLDAGWDDGRKFACGSSFRLRIRRSFPASTTKAFTKSSGTRESFDIPEDWRAVDLLLNFGAVDYRSTVWVNGQEVGHNQGGHVPFQFDIAPYLQAGSESLHAARRGSTGSESAAGQTVSHRLAAGIDYYCTTGIWQTVWLEPVPPIRIEEIQNYASADRNSVRTTRFFCTRLRGLAD